VRPARLVSVVAFIAVLLLAGVAVAGTIQPEVGVAKHRDGPYSSLITLNVPEGKEKSAFARVKNLNKFKFNMHLDGDVFQSGDAIKARWFKGRRDVTKQVKHGGYDFGLGPGRKRVFRVEIAAKGNAGACVVSTFSYTQDHSGGVPGFIGVNGDGCAG
jgi:hypothetical protein